MNQTIAFHHSGFNLDRFVAWFARMIRVIAYRYQHHMTLNELAKLDSHMLADIGLTQGDLNTITFKRTFDSRNKFDLQDIGRY